jgi:hypothetical protein
MRRTAGLLLGVVLAACTPTAVPRTPAPTASAAATAAPTSVASDPPSPAPSAPTAAVPAPGGTCNASQFVITSSPVAFPGYGVLGTVLVFVEQRVRNAGKRCVLQLPEVVGLASGTGEVQPMRVTITRGHTSLTIEPGESLTIVLGDHWWSGVYNESGETALPAPRCDGAITGIDRAEFPFASGSIAIAWDKPWVWREVCADPPSGTLAVERYIPPVPAVVAFLYR